MKIGLASYEFRNQDIEFNLSQIEKAMQSVSGKVNLLCFGEAFLQGFDSLRWDYNIDQHIAVTQRNATMGKLCDLTLQYDIALLVGYIESYQGRIYSSCAVMNKGRVIFNYRRISTGWKDPLADGHYCEGHVVQEFELCGKYFKIALCGDMWDFPLCFKTDHVLIWPVYVNFSLCEWKKYENEYAEQASIASRQTLMINSLTHNPKSHGGAFFFVDGKIVQKTDYDKEEILFIDL